MFVEYIVEWIDRLERQGWPDDLIVEKITDKFDVDPQVIMEIIKGHKL